MAKKAQTFAEKSARQGTEVKKMAKLVLSEKKANGHFSFRTKMVPVDDVKSTLARSRS